MLLRVPSLISLNKKVQSHLESCQVKMDSSSAFKFLPVLIKIARSSESQRRLALKYAPNEVIDALSELSLNLHYDRVPLTQRQKVCLARCKKAVKQTADPRESVQDRRRTFSQQGGSLVTTVLSLALPTLIELAAKKFYEKYQKDSTK